MQHKYKQLGAVLALMLVLFSQIALAVPEGASVAAGTPVTKGFFASGTIGAQGGNATSLNASTETQTIAWQGFFGQVFGNLTLEDNSGDIMFTFANATSGLVFASRDDSVDFASIAGQQDCTIDEALTGTNSDRVSNTFTNASLSGFNVGMTSIPAACRTFTYVNNETQSTSFEEVILTDDGGTTSVYATQIEEDVTGFDGQPHDFQMIVPDATNTTTSTYFFYMELR